ncbi:MAG: toll/interleukin-1 receptor domain-containing protein [Actinomycetota bacterium]|nr:toll/interleukin-1 receptor domain-containing protein [Actinomycetota bacterium]
MADVFISYRRSGSALLANLIYDKLVARGVSTFVDTRDSMGQGKFPDLLRRQIEQASTVIVLLEPEWLSSPWMQEEVRYATQLGRTLLPVFTEDYEMPSGPQPDHIHQLLSHNGVRVLNRGGLFIDESLVSVVEIVTSQPTPHTRPSVEVALDQLPLPAVDRLVGREQESLELRRHLDDPDVAVVVVSGFGGTGKSSLVDAFLSDIAPEYGGATKVFAWHFNSQEEAGANIASSAPFWERSLRFFGTQSALPASEIQRARELARGLRLEPGILVLDGIESLQFPPHIQRGQLADQAMQTFLTTIGRNGLPNGGLILVTSRQPVVELSRFRFVRSLELQMLDATSGGDLLRQLGVRGSMEEILSAVQEHQGHPLSLVLLGRMLTDSYNGDVLHRTNLEAFDAGIEDGVGLILDQYVRDWDEDSPELNFLYSVSLFRRPAQESELELLTGRSDLGRRLRMLSGNELRRAVGR